MIRTRIKFGENQVQEISVLLMQLTVYSLAILDRIYWRAIKLRYITTVDLPRDQMPP